MRDIIRPNDPGQYYLQARRCDDDQLAGQIGPLTAREVCAKLCEPAKPGYYRLVLEA